MGLAMLAELITHVSLDSERKLAKVVDVCRAYRLTDSAKTVHKVSLSYRGRLSLLED